MNETQYKHSFDEGTGHLIEAANGHVKATFDKESRVFNIGYVFVDRAARGRGISKQLVEIARQKAVELGAERITAKLVSREAVDVGRSVFGDDAVRVEYLGGYDQDERPVHLQRGTRGHLDYQVPPAEEIEVPVNA